MHTKLILRIEALLIKAAKKYPKVHGLLVTKVNNSQEKILKTNLPITETLKGILRRKDIHEEDYRKYVKDEYK